MHEEKGRNICGKCYDQIHRPRVIILETQKNMYTLFRYENHDIAIAMSPSRADPVLPWLGVFKCLYQSHCTDWGYLNI